MKNLLQKLKCFLGWHEPERVGASGMKYHLIVNGFISPTKQITPIVIKCMYCGRVENEY